MPMKSIWFRRWKRGQDQQGLLRLALPMASVFELADFPLRSRHDAHELPGQATNAALDSASAEALARGQRESGIEYPERIRHTFRLKRIGPTVLGVTLTLLVDDAEEEERLGHEEQACGTNTALSNRTSREGLG